MKKWRNWLKSLALVAIFLCSSVAMAACGFGSQSESYLITYYANDGTGSYRTETCHDYEKDAFYLRGISFDRPWYRFVGWNTAADGTGTAYKSYTEYQITGDLNLYAIWEDATRQITYHANDGTEQTTIQTFDSSRLYVNLKANDAFTRTGYEIIKWNTAADGSGTAYSPRISYDLNDNLDLYAVWQLKNYFISYNYYTDNGSSLSGVTAAGNPREYNIETQTFTLQAPSKTGYTFEGWYREREFINPVTEITQGSTGDICLYAKFSLIPYTITYELDGGSNGDNPSTYDVTTSTFTLQAPTKDGYYFVGWYSDSNFTNQITKIKFGTTGNMTLYAKWYSAAEVYSTDNSTITGLTDLGKTLNIGILDIPNQIDGVTITSIGAAAFRSNETLTEVTIPNSVTSIGDDAFSGCSGLTSVTIGNSVTSIGEQAFYGCSGLTSVTIPENVTSIGRAAFYDCSGLTSVIIPDSVTSIGRSAFSGCSGLTSVIIPDSVTSIGDSVFWGCSGLTSVTIGNGVARIGDYAFRNCTSLSEVYITDLCAWYQIDFSNNDEPDYYISSNPLHNGAKLYLNNVYVPVTGDLIIPDGVTHIGSYAFSGCDDITSITIPASVTSVGEYAFYRRSSNLSKVYITDLGAWCQIDFANDWANPLTDPYSEVITGYGELVRKKLVKVVRCILTINW